MLGAKRGEHALDLDHKPAPDLLELETGMRLFKLYSLASTKCGRRLPVLST
jgi:hypothetical protein